MIALVITPGWFFFTVICVVAILWFRYQMKKWSDEWDEWDEGSGNK